MREVFTGDGSTASKPLVSVVVPVYNHARFVLPAIRSVLDQTYRPIELIIIDDGSTDGSAEVVSEFQRTYKPADGIEIKFSARENRGAPETINEAIRAAKGDYIAILNSDDLYLPSRLQECWEFLISQKARLVFTYVQPIDEFGAELPFDHSWRQWYLDTLMKELDVAPSISFLLLSRNIAVSSGNLFFHRTVVSDVGFFAQYRYAHDLDFLLRYSLLEEPLILRKVLYKYRQHGSNTISQDHDAAVAETIAIGKQYLIACLSDKCRNPVAPSFENWPASLNESVYQGFSPFLGALDALLAEPPASTGRKVAASSNLNPHESLDGEITIVSHELSRTGAPMLVLELARSLKHLGLRVNVISMADGPLREEFVASDIPIKALDSSGFIWWLATLGRIFHRIQYLPARLGRAFPALANRAPRISPRLGSLSVRVGDFFLWLASATAVPKLAATIRGTLLINSFASFPLAFQLLSRWRGSTFWYIHETFDPQILLRSGSARKRFDELYRSKQVRLFFGSEATRQTWAQYGFDGFVRYWSGLSASHAGPRTTPLSPRRTILSVGTSGTRKGTRFLLEAFAHARSHGWVADDVELIIVGCPPPSVTAQARDFVIRSWKSDLRGSVRLVPSVSAEVLEQFYRNADLYVQSSTMECLPLTLLMAMAHGLPIITTDVDGCREAIQHGENGVLIPARRIEPLAEAIANLLNDKAKAEAFGRRAAQKFLDKFSAEATIGPIATVLMNRDSRDVPVANAVPSTSEE
jgi:glycosyltransferase involved in cell wall biosynthesis